MLTFLTNIRSTKMLHHASYFMHHALQVGGSYVDCYHKYKIKGVTVGGRRPSVEDVANLGPTTLLRLYQLSELTLLFTPSNSDLKWLRYDQIAIL